MKRLMTSILLIFSVSTVSPATAAKHIVVDWETGEVIVTEDPVDEAAEDSAAIQNMQKALAGEEKIEKMKRIVEIQQKVIRGQRMVIKQQEKELEHKDNLLSKMERLLMRCH